MLTVIASIIFLARLAKFSKLKVANLPGATQDNIEEMHKASKIALCTSLGFAVLSFLIWRIATSHSRAIAIGIIDLVLQFSAIAVSITFDRKAARIEKLCRSNNQSMGSEMPPQSERHLVVRVLGWIAIMLGSLLAASAAAQIVMGMIYGPTIVGLILGLLFTVVGLSMAMPGKKQKQ